MPVPHYPVRLVSVDVAVGAWIGVGENAARGFGGSMGGQGSGL